MGQMRELKFLNNPEAKHLKIKILHLVDNM